MPLYEYSCRDCGTDFEELVFHRDAQVACPDCASDDVQRKLSAFAIHGTRADGGKIAASSCNKSDCSGCGSSCSCGH